MKVETLNRVSEHSNKLSRNVSYYYFIVSFFKSTLRFGAKIGKKEKSAINFQEFEINLN